MAWPGFRKLLAPLAKGAAGEGGKKLGGAASLVLLAWLSTFWPPFKEFLGETVLLRWATLLAICCGVALLGAAVVLLFAWRRIARLSREAAMDFQLGIYNAKECEARMSQMLRLFERDANYHTTFVLLDLDDFKHLNEKHGYSGGDAVLRQFVDLMRRCTRESDVLCRYRSGDEFLLILPQSLASGGCVVADRIREKTQRYEFAAKAGGSPIRLTVSAGVLCIDKSTSEINMEELRAQLDRHLSAAKLAKNRVVDRLDEFPKLTSE